MKVVAYIYFELFKIDIAVMIIKLKALNNSV